MLRMGASTLLSIWGVLLALGGCGGRTGDVEQTLFATGGTLGSATVSTDPRPGQGGSETFVTTQSTDAQNMGGMSSVVLTPFTGGDTSVITSALTGGTDGAGGVPSNIGGATMVAVGGTLCALSYNGTTNTTLVSQELCGNTFVEYGNGEECDDGNQLSGDGCSNTCRLESNYPCGDGCHPCITLVICGDGRVTGTEVCDDGNMISGDGCDATCSSVEPEWICYIPGKRCTYLPNCGDGIVQADEQCDEGPNNAPNRCGACTSICRFGVYCGDGVVQPDCGEMCDDGVNSGAFGQCQPDCTMAPYCGDGIWQPEFGEACDEGTLNNTGAYGHCAHNCTMPVVCDTRTIYLDGGITIRTGCED